MKFASEVGQTTVEYTAVTAIALVLVVFLTWLVLGEALESALADLMDRFMAFILDPFA